MPDDEGKVIEEGEGGDFFGSLLNGFSQFWVESEFHVHCCCSTFEDTEGADNGRRHAIEGLIDFEIAQGAFGLGAPVFVRRNLDLAKGIAFGSCRHGSDAVKSQASCPGRSGGVKGI